MLARHAHRVLFPVLFPAQAGSEMAWESSAGDITLTATSPSLPPPLSGERYHLPQLLPSQELENFNFPGSRDSARGLMSITQALKQDLTWTWIELNTLLQH